MAISGFVSVEQLVVGALTGLIDLVRFQELVGWIVFQGGHAVESAVKVLPESVEDGWQFGSIPKFKRLVQIAV